MKFVFASYIATNSYTQPKAWLNRIRAYTGILEALAINHEVISIEQIDHEGRHLKNGVNYHFLNFYKSAILPIKLNRYIKQQNPDVVFIQSLHFPLQVILLRWCLGTKIKIIVQNHAEKPYFGIKKRLQLWAERYVNAYLFASTAMGMDWIAQGNLSSPQKIHEVMEVSSVFYPINKIQAINYTQALGSPVFLWVGRLDQNKDPLTVVKAFLKYNVIKPESRLYMIYHTTELLLEIETLLSAESNGGSITLVGKVPNDELLYWFNSADFIVSGSYHEGAGTAVCEAMSCGCVPIITDIFSFRMMTNNASIGRLYKPGDEQQLLAALIQTQQMDLADQREKALAFFKSYLSFEAIARDIARIAAEC